MRPEMWRPALPLVRVGGVLPGLRLVIRMGVPIERLLSQAGLPILGWDDPQALLPARQVFELAERADRLTGMEDLGLRVGEQIRFAQLGPFGRVVMHSLTLHDAITNACRLVALHNSCSRCWISSWGDQVRLCHKYVGGLDVGRRHTEQVALMILLDLVRSAAGPHWRPREIHLEEEPTPLVAGFEILSEARILFRQECTAVVVPPSLLSLPLGTGGTGTDLAQTRAAAAAFDLPSALRQVIDAWLPQGDPGIDTAAEAAGLSTRTLQRRLADQGLTYSQLVDQARFQRARRLLQDPAVQVTDIAFAVGYTEVPNFTRAFRRWTGVTPSEFRRLREEEEERGEIGPGLQEAV